MKFTAENGLTVNVATSGRARDLVPYAELPNSVRGKFSYVADNLDDHDGWDVDPRFFYYRGEWHDTGDADRLFISGGWGLGFALTLWSAVVFKYATIDECDIDPARVIVGYAVWD